MVAAIAILSHSDVLRLDTPQNPETDFDFVLQNPLPT